MVSKIQPKGRITRIIACCIIALFFFSMMNCSITLGLDDTIKKSIVDKSKDSKSSFHCISFNATIMKKTEQIMRNIQPIDGNIIFSAPNDQITPYIGKTNAKDFGIAYYDKRYDNISVIATINGGRTWSNPFIFTMGQTYPTADKWSDYRLFTTGVTNPNYYGGGTIQVSDWENTSDPGSWKHMVYIIIDDGWYGMKDASISCDNSGEWWEFGYGSYIMSCTEHGGFSDAPLITWIDPLKGDTLWLGWWNEIENCLHCDNDIDLVSHLHYAIYDFFNISTKQWKIFLIQTDFNDPRNLDLWKNHVFDEISNIYCPAVAAYNDTVIVLAEYEENGSRDIICYYSTDGIYGFQRGFMVNSTELECCPTIIHKEKNTFVSSFIRDGNIYTTWTMDGGAHWTPPYKVNENFGRVQDSYKSSCLGDPYLIWEECHQDIDLFLEQITRPPDPPEIEGKNTGIIGESYDLTITSNQSDGLNVSYFIEWGDGSNNSWTELYPSDKPITIKHIYDSENIFHLKAKSRNEKGAESIWSFHQIIMGKNKAREPFLLRFIEYINYLFLRLLILTT